MKVFELVGRIVIDSNEANKEIDNTTQKAEKAHAGLGKSLVKFSGKAATGMVVLATALYNVAEKTSEYRTQMGQLETAFVTQGHSADAAKATYKSLMGVLGDSGQATEAALHIAKLAENEQEMKNWTEICTGVFSTFGESLPIESLTESANETAKVGQVTGGLADALNWAGILEDEFNKKLAACPDEAERQDLVMNTLTATYGAAAAQYEKTNADVSASNEAHDDLTGAMADLAEAAGPAITTVINVIKDLATWATPVVEALSDAVVALGEAWEGLKKMMTPIVSYIAVGYKRMGDVADAFQEDPVGVMAQSAEGGEILQNMMWNALLSGSPTSGGGPSHGGATGPAFNAKGAVFSKPTLFDTRLGKQVVGEAGPEAVAPISVLQKYVADAVDNSNGHMAALLEKILEAILAKGDDMEEKITRAMASMRFEVNGREFARLVKAVT